MVVFQQKQLFEDWDKISGKFRTEKETRGQEGSHQLSGIYVNILGIIGCIGKLQGVMKRTKIIWRKLLSAVSYINIRWITNAHCIDYVLLALPTVEVRTIFFCVLWNYSFFACVFFLFQTTIPIHTQ